MFAYQLCNMLEWIKGRDEMIFIWDWNGTLLDDIKESMHALNEVCKYGGKKEIHDLDLYRKLFQFPVKEYYRKVGFDFEQISFDTLAKIYMADYQPKAISAPLFHDALTCLKRIKQLNIDQYLLSASDLTYLHQQLSYHQLQPYFKAIYGLNNIHAKSKKALAHLLVQEQNINLDEVYFIGDSVHDYEVATSVSCKCILIASGHEHIDKLKACGCVVLADLKQFYDDYLK